MNVIELVKKALDWRANFQNSDKSSTLRLFCGTSDGLKGLWIDRYGELIIVSLYQSHLIKLKKSILVFFHELNPKFEVLFKIKTTKGFDSDLSSLEHREFECEELGCRYIIKTDIKHDFGLFIDTYTARRWLREHSRNRSILNLFSYTCAFAVVGKKYDAGQVTNIDPNKDYLNWGKMNAAINQLDFRNLCDSAQKYLARHVRRLKKGKDQVYDIVIADPPAFLIGRGDDRLGRKVWPKLLEWFGETKSEYFILICNDRSFRQGRDLKHFFSEGLGRHYQLTQLEHSLDVLGQNFNRLQLDDDYLPPDIFIASKV